MIPIVIVCYNNIQYVKNTIEQLSKINEEYLSQIYIMDNNSNDEGTLEYLKNCTFNVIFNKSNNGPWVTSNCNSELYNKLPEKFILTDPDLEFLEEIPNDFIKQISVLSDIYKTHKIGVALKIDDFNKMYQGEYHQGKNIYDWEINFWRDKIDNSDYELYNAPIDTTFCLINKKYTNGSIRIAGKFTVRHIPWYIENFLTPYEKYKIYSKDAVFSTTRKITLEYLMKKYLFIDKGKEQIMICNNSNDPNYNFWMNIYKIWELSTFEIFDRYLNKDKIFIDIGAWIGTTCIYGSRKSKHVFTVEADRESVIDLRRNVSNNCRNVTIIDRAIFNENNKDTFFGKNTFRSDSKLNDSTSQIKSVADNDTFIVKTITIEAILQENSITRDSISLIKVDIEGGEENILEDLFKVKNEYNCPLYISFHVSWWKDVNIERFSFLNEETIIKIKNNPFESILFP